MNKNFIITENCQKEEEHDFLEYNEFFELLKKNEIKNINFKNKNIQKYTKIYKNITLNMKLIKIKIQITLL